MFGKFYCKNCHRIKNRFQVKSVDCYYYTGYECRYCHQETEPVDDMLIRLNDEINKKANREQIASLKDWINKEAVERYPKSPAEKKAFKAGIYALLDNIGFDYEMKED